MWQLLRYNWERGWRTAWYDYIVMPRIVRWRIPEDFPLEARVEIHLLTSQRDWKFGLWMLASFFQATRRRWAIVVHDDGSCDETIRSAFATVFPEARFIDRAEADAVMEPKLATRPQCRDYRQAHPLGLKLFDVPAFARTARVLMLDSDVLFFREPREILDWVDGGGDGTWFNADFQHSCNVTPEQALEKWGIKLWPLVNSGIVLLDPTIIDPAFCEECLVEGTVRTSGWTWCIEQTLFSLCASRAGRGGLLPKTYEVSFAPKAAEGIVARHYVGFVRQQFLSEGLRRLYPVLFK
jgi:hypothetical protein